MGINEDADRILNERARILYRDMRYNDNKDSFTSLLNAMVSVLCEMSKMNLKYYNEIVRLSKESGSGWKRDLYSDAILKIRNRKTRKPAIDHIKQWAGEQYIFDLKTTSKNVAERRKEELIAEGYRVRIYNYQKSFTLYKCN